MKNLIVNAIKNQNRFNEASANDDWNLAVLGTTFQALAAVNACRHETYGLLKKKVTMKQFEEWLLIQKALNTKYEAFEVSNGPKKAC